MISDEEIEALFEKNWIIDPPLHQIVERLRSAEDALRSMIETNIALIQYVDDRGSQRFGINEIKQARAHLAKLDGGKPS